MYGPWAFCCWSMAPLLELLCVVVAGMVHSGQSKQNELSGSKAEASWADFCCIAGNLLEGCPLQASSHSCDVLFPFVCTSQCIQIWWTSWVLDSCDLSKQTWLYLHVTAFLAKVELSHLCILSKAVHYVPLNLNCSSGAVVSSQLNFFVSYQNKWKASKAMFCWTWWGRCGPLLPSGLFLK